MPISRILLSCDCNRRRPRSTRRRRDTRAGGAEATIDHCLSYEDGQAHTNKVVAWLDPSALAVPDGEASLLFSEEASLRAEHRDVEEAAAAAVERMSEERAQRLGQKGGGRGKRGGKKGMRW